MRVVDAGVVVAMMTRALPPSMLGDEELAAPHLLDSEVVHALRGMVLRRALSDEQGSRALAWLLRLEITRFAADSLRQRMWELRHHLSGYDATYVALAEVLEATSLLTTDARLARAPGLRCDVQLL